MMFLINVTVNDDKNQYLNCTMNTTVCTVNPYYYPLIKIILSLMR